MYKGTTLQSSSVPCLHAITENLQGGEKKM